MSSDRGAAPAKILIVLVLLAAIGAGAYFWMQQQQKAKQLQHEEDAAFEKASGSGMVTSALRGLPADSFVIGTIANLTAYGAGLRETALGKLLTDAELREKAKAALASGAGPEELKDFDAFLATASEVSELGLRSLSFSLHPLPADAGEPVGSILVAACDDPAKVTAWIASKMSARVAAAPAPPATASPAAATEATGASGSTGAASAAGAPPAALKTGTLEGTSYTCDDDLCWATRGNVVLLARPLAALAHYLQTAGADAPAAAQARIDQAIERCGGRAEGLFLFADLKQLVAASKPAVEKDADSAQTLAALGLEGLDSVAYAQRVEGPAFHDRAVLTYDPAKSGVIGSLLDLPPGTLTFDGLFPANSGSAAFGRMPDLAQTWDRVFEAVRKVLPPEESAQLDQTVLGLSAMLGIDLRNDVLAAFGGEWGLSYSSLPPTAARSAEQSLQALHPILVLGVKDAPKVDSLLKRLETFAKAQQLKLASEPLADGTLFSLELPGKDAGGAAVALAKSKLWLGTDANDVKAAVEGKAAALPSDAAYGNLRATFPKEASAVTFARQPGATFQQMFSSYLEGFRLAKQAPLDATVRDLGAIAGAVEAYKAENGFAPRVTSLAALQPLFVPTFAKTLPRTDAWGKPLSYTGNEQGYVVWSLGEDGAPENDWSHCAAGCQLDPPADPNKEDLVIASGHAVRGVKPASGDARPQAPAYVLPAPLTDLEAALSRHLMAWPPAMSTTSAHAGTIEYESLAPVALGAAPGVAASALVPRLAAAAGGGDKQKQSLALLRQVGGAVEAYAAAHPGAPLKAESLAELKPLVEPTYIAELPIADAWGTPLFFRAGPKGYVVASAGADRNFEEDWSGCAAGCRNRSAAVTRQEQDLVLAGGAFVRAPAETVR